MAFCSKTHGHIESSCSVCATGFASARDCDCLGTGGASGLNPDRALVWADENVSDWVFLVSEQPHSPSGRVGPLGPERAFRFAKKHFYQSPDCPTRPLHASDLPAAPRGGKAQPYKHFRQTRVRVTQFLGIQGPWISGSNHETSLEFGIIQIHVSACVGGDLVA